MPVGRMLRRMSSREFAHWLALDRISPIGQQRLDFLVAHILEAFGAQAGVTDKQFVDYLPRYSFADPLTPAEKAERRRLRKGHTERERALLAATADHMARARANVEARRKARREAAQAARKAGKNRKRKEG